MTSPALKFDDPPDPAADPGSADWSVAPDVTPAHESLFESIVGFL
jgi:hypothetical protein